MTEDGPVVGVLKFGCKKHIEQFAQGLLYMNTLEHFIKIETSSPRKDSHEGTSHICRGDGSMLQIKVGGKYSPIVAVRGPVRHTPDDSLKVNVFCMYALHESPSGIFVDPDNLGFGDTFAVLTDFDEFMKRVEAAVVGTGQALRCGLVGYVDETSYRGPMGIFRKGSSFSYQNEFRIALLPGTGEALPLDVGNLSDIVWIGVSRDLQYIKLQRYRGTGGSVA
ncbi:MAG: hypothetical protein ABSH56_35380 [Bryobacteraceae bacterium]|jgi:hypothetical protein